MNPGYLAELEHAIRFRLRCSAEHLQTVFVHEKNADNETVWFGDVEVFDLIQCKEAKSCYAWQGFEAGVRVVTILHSRLVDSPHRAIQAAIFSGVQLPMFAVSGNPAIFKHRMDRAKKALYDAQIKAEDLEAMIQTTRQTSESISQKRR